MPLVKPPCPEVTTNEWAWPQQATSSRAPWTASGQRWVGRETKECAHTSEQKSKDRQVTPSCLARTKTMREGHAAAVSSSVSAGPGIQQWIVEKVWPGWLLNNTKSIVERNRHVENRCKKQQNTESKKDSAETKWRRNTKDSNEIGECKQRQGS
jgi:hypothetical protein